MPDFPILRLLLRRDERGAAAVELALLLPLLALLLAGVADLGLALWQHQVVVKSSRDAVRFLARTPDPWADPTFEAQAANLARTGNLAGSGSPLADNIAATFRYPIAAGALGLSGSDRTVIGIVSFDFSPFTGFGLLPKVTLRASHIERYIGE